MGIYYGARPAGGPNKKGLVTSFTKTRGSVRGVVSLAASLLLPVEGLCDKFTWLPFTPVQRAGEACKDALKAPTL